jgi:hypothetical protein
VKVADVQVSHDGIDGLPAYGDRASPRRAQGKHQGQAESDHGREPADEQGRPLRSVRAVEFTINAAPARSRTAT